MYQPLNPVVLCLGCLSLDASKGCRRGSNLFNAFHTKHPKDFHTKHPKDTGKCALQLAPQKALGNVFSRQQRRTWVPILIIQKGIRVLHLRAEATQHLLSPSSGCNTGFQIPRPTLRCNQGVCHGPISGPSPVHTSKPGLHTQCEWMASSYSQIHKSRVSAINPKSLLDYDES